MPLSSTSPGLDLPTARRELAAGLLHAQPRIAPKFFYDALGSKLFEAICQLDEYYLTRAEAAIFREFAGEIAQAAGQGAALIDLGAGNCEKAAGLFESLQPSRYIPVDISAAFLADAVENLRQKFPRIPMHPVGMDFSEHFALPAAARGPGPKLFFYPGSSLGNFSPPAAIQFLHRLRAACGDAEGAVLIGVDLVKATETLTAAYDDALGVTAAFNLNILRHVNRLLGSDFDTRDFAHVALYNAALSRIEMHLRARHEVTVRWPGAARSFAAGERIHTENSHKFTRRGLIDLLAQTGFGEPTCWSDPAEQFLLCHARKI